MPKNITYHQTGAQKARRTRNDAFGVAGLGLAGVGATKDKKGLGVAGKMMQGRYKANRNVYGKSPVSAARNAVKGLNHPVNVQRLKAIHPGRAAAEAAVIGGAATGVLAEARNIHHTRAEQKLRRNRGVSKAMATKKTYCKQHGKFDACAEQPGNPSLKDDQYVSKGLVGDVAAVGRLKAAQGVSRLKVKAGLPGGVSGGKFLAGQQGKANLAARREKKALGPLAIVGKRHGPGGGNVGDDGIHHLTSVERVKTSPETRANGNLVLLVGRRKMDGTPKTGHGDGTVSSKISESHKQGSAPKVPLGKSLDPHAAFLDL